MEPYPIFLDLTNRSCVVVGGGAVALSKVRGLRAAGARVRVVAPELVPELAAMAAAAEVEHVARAYAAGDLAGATLAIAATDDPALNRRVADEARAAGALVNVVDDPAACDWTAPAVARQGGIAVAVSTGGRSPSVARLLRERIATELLAPGLAELLEVVAEERRARIARGANLAYEVWAAAITPEALARAAAGDREGARAAVRLRLADRGLQIGSDGRASGAGESGDSRGNDNASEPNSRSASRKPQAAIARPGVVYLVGAGPGDPGLLTLRGRELLATADVVLYDRLVEPALLALARADAELVYVGKHGGGAYVPQDAINARLVAAAQAGRSVVRLKGGDPFVFGRGGEECAALAAAGVPYEVVPGVSAAVAVPAAAGIPVTDRRLASSFAVITGHEDPARPDTRLDWAALARLDTLVVLMGVRRLPAITRALLDHGMAPATPAALVRRGTLPDQEVLTGTLADIAERARAAGLRPPAVLVLGEVVRLRERLVDALVAATRAGG